MESSASIIYPTILIYWSVTQTPPTNRAVIGLLSTSKIHAENFSIRLDIDLTLTLNRHCSVDIIVYIFVFVVVESLICVRLCVVSLTILD